MKVDVFVCVCVCVCNGILDFTIVQALYACTFLTYLSNIHRQNEKNRIIKVTLIVDCDVFFFLQFAVLVGVVVMVGLHILVIYLLCFCPRVLVVVVVSFDFTVLTFN